MSDAEVTNTEFSILLWLVAAVVAVLSAHVGMAWIQRARRRPSMGQSWPAQLLAAITLGTGFCASGALALSAEGLHYPVGFGSVAAPVLWLGTMIGSLPLVLWLTHSQRWWTLLITGALLAGLAAGAEVGWVWAAGLRPGVTWKLPWLGAAMAVLFTGCICGLWVASAERTVQGDPRKLWRVGAALIFGLSVLSGQELVLAATDLALQRGSVYRHQLPSNLLSLACAVLVPLTLAVMAIDLAIRRRRRRETDTDFLPHKRRKRRHRVRTL